MKRISFLLLAGLAICTACSKDNEAGKPDPVDPNPSTVETKLSINVAAETKTMVMGGLTPLWVKTDTLVVFDNTGKAVKFTTEANREASAVFTTNSWTEGNTPGYASCSAAVNDAAGTSEGVLTVKLADAQRLVEQQSYGRNASALVGVVEGEEGNYTISSMKNVSGLLKIAIDRTDIASITIDAVGGEQLAGYADVNYSKLVAGDADFWTASAGKETSSSVVLTPGGTAINEDGCFKANYYYVSLLPGTYSQGLRFTLRDTLDAVLVQRTAGAESGITIARNEVRELSMKLDDLLPKTITLDLNFYNDANVNPLGFGALTLDQEDGTNGETYTYSYDYTFQGAAKNVGFDFVMCKGTTSGARYYYAAPSSLVYSSGTGTHIMIVVTAGSWLKTPAIPNRYLQSITFSHGNGAAKRIQLRKEVSGTAFAFTSQAAAHKATATALDTQVLEFFSSGHTLDGATQTGGTTAANTSYYIYFDGTSTRVYDIKLVYTNKLPDPE